jgi:uncharacterized protein DUF6111
MLRLVELALFASPFLVFAGWRYFASGSGPSIRVVAAAACVVIVLAVALLWLGEDRAISPHDAYAPARFENGHIIAGHGVPP